MQEMVAFAHALKGKTDLGGQWQALYDIARAHGFDKVIYGFVPAVMTQPFDDEIIWLRHCPEPWEEHYQLFHFADNDPVVRHCSLSVRPMDWCILEQYSENGMFDEPTRRICLDAREFGMRRGISFPLRDGTGAKGGVSFGASKDVGEKEYRRDIAPHYELVQTCAEYFHAYANRHALSARRYQLTDRERECLKWLCDGKQQKCIAHAMGVCPATVEGYVRSLKRKLYAATIPQIVARAISLNLLDT